MSGLPNETIELIQKAKSGDAEAQNTLVKDNIGLVWSIVRRFQNRGYEMEDLYQIGCIGLIKAIEKFDLSYNVKFSTYAVPMIIGEIKRFIRDDGIIKVSRSLKELFNKTRVAREILSKEQGKEPTLKEISNYLGIPEEDLVVAMEAGAEPESLYSAVGDGDNSSILLIDRIDGQRDETGIDLIDKIALRQVIDTLEPREKQIILLRYFKQKTQMQIANMLGVSQVQVSRIEKKILKQLRQKIEMI
ncbi:MAG TPA: RNA polymerase sporulation sigma factor SigF [Clostridiaceae bacterium]|nr:RNA polymerase sporulation sigma factor SigF [Clostridiaceae bacterium]